MSLPGADILAPHMSLAALLTTYPLQRGYALQLVRFHISPLLKGPIISFKVSDTTRTTNGGACLFFDTHSRTVSLTAFSNVGIMLCFMIFFTGTYLLASEKVRAKSKGEMLRVLRNRSSTREEKKTGYDIEAVLDSVNSGCVKSPSANVSGTIARHTACFTWSDISYTIPVKKKKELKVLDCIDGYVKPGTLTALMVSRSVSNLGSTDIEP